MENIKLIEKHRKRIALLMALFLFLCLYLVVIVFLLTSSYYKNIQWNEELKNTTERVKSIILTYDTLSASNDDTLINIVQEVLTNAYVWTEDWVVIDNIPNENLNSYNLKDGDFEIVDWKRFYKTSVSNNSEIYHIIVSNNHQGLISQIAKSLLILILISPILYSIFAYLLCKFMTQMYKPLKDVVINLESFASNINHEFKTSLSEIISSLELARLTKEYESANEYSISSARRLNSMLDTLWMLIHFVNSDYRKERVNLYKALDESIDDLERLISDKHIKLEKKYNPERSLYKYVDKAPVILSFQNILKNAIKYSEIGGKIEIGIYRDHFSIKDYWVWIEKENLDKIFDRYFRESYSKSWSGIGLSIIKRITEIYNWDINIQSKKWKYTKVTVTF